MLGRKKAEISKAGVDKKVQSTSTFKIPITRRSFIRGTLLASTATVLSHFMPPLPKPISILGTKRVYAALPPYCYGMSYCPGPYVCSCPGWVACWMGCADLCYPWGDGCYDFYTFKPLFVWESEEYEPGVCCCDVGPGIICGTFMDYGSCNHLFCRRNDCFVWDICGW